MSETEDQSSASKVMSALTAITSLASSLLPNALDLQQLQQLITSLIQMPTTATNRRNAINDSTDCMTEETRIQVRRERHRQTERVRHNTIVALIRQLSQMSGLQDRHESQANVLNRSARYVLFLSNVIDKLMADSADDSIDILSEEWLQSLYPLYQKACEEALSLVQSCREEVTTICGSDLPQDNRSRDHCIQLN